MGIVVLHHILLCLMVDAYVHLALLEIWCVDVVDVMCGYASAYCGADELHIQVEVECRRIDDPNFLPCDVFVSSSSSFFLRDR